MTTVTSLPRSTPVEQSVDPAAVLAFLDAVERNDEVELHSLMVVKHGHVVAEGWWSPHTPERTRLLYSISKSFTSTALGFALQEHLLDLDDTVVSLFPELAHDIVDRRTRSMTLRHLASMASGHDRDMIDETLAADGQEPVRGFLLAPPDREPGSLFAYNQPCTYTLAAAIQRAAGMSLTEYLRPRLLDPLGIGEVGWLSWPPGREQGFSGLFARTEDVGKLGQLYLQRGRWGDEQLIPAAYVEAATSRQVDTSHWDGVEWQQGYGFQFWMSRHGYRGDGAFAQFCLVLPEHDAVVAMTGGTEAMQAVLDAVWEHLLPGLDTEAGDGAAQPDLDRRLEGLTLAPCVARPAPPRWDDWTARPFPVTGRPAALTTVEVRRGPGGLEATIADPGDAITFPVGSSDWEVSEPLDAQGDRVPVAASGGWTDDGSLRVEVIFLESPHRMDITCSLPEASARAAWRDEPLGAYGLRGLHRPR